MFKTGDRVRFQHMNPTTPDRRNGTVGTVVEFPSEEKAFIAMVFFGEGVKQVQWDSDGALGIATPAELTLVGE